MKKLYSLLEVIEFPIKMLFLAIVLMSIGDLFINPNVLPYININNTYVTLASNGLKYFGSFLIQSFPLLLLIKLLSKRYEDSVPAYVGVVSYILFLVVTMLLSSTELPAYCYSSIMGIHIDTSIISNTASGIRYPLTTGIISSFIVFAIVRNCYGSSRKRYVYGILSFIDNDTWALITSILVTIVVSIVFTLVWPFAIAGIQNIINFIAADIYNPVNMFVYGILDRISSVFGLQELIRAPFWQGTAGGSWMDAFGQTYTGDVNIWTILVAQNSETLGYGRFITPFYVLNMFAIPGLLLGAFTLFTDKMEKRRYIMMFIFAIIISVVSGSLLPIELFLLVSAPFLFVFHILATGTLYAVFSGLGISLGYSFTGSLADAMPGNLISMLPYFGNENYGSSLQMILIVGGISFVVYFLVTILYYKVLAGDFLDFHSNKIKIHSFITAVGEVENIRVINSSLNKISIQLIDPTKVDYEELKEIGVFKVKETRAGISMEFGPISTILHDGVKKEIKRYQAELKRKPVVSSNEMKEN